MLVTIESLKSLDKTLVPYSTDIPTRLESVTHLNKFKAKLLQYMEEIVISDSRSYMLNWKLKHLSIKRSIQDKNVK